ncbi:signal transduction protein [Actinoplanes sp. SE50]|uniref:NACHT domain-containing protein n=1 Tax=unclassified Actinoplanes TaxID=2626549 RepID=UPI00023ED08C|nr:MULTISPECIES: NACHT domain-containing protein [unclassified Actinoplanes]AEV84910.1 signal transduction protein [Actinoplanes sp. SE50/110]ATO83301.1 signal transduction protein [Actinoplanes sp. SE50]SLM00708.1 signal transduction protein [Actinoplanes sp. SE50/110]
MAGGRPSQGKQQRYDELEELAAWFRQALGDAGFGSVHEFVATGMFEKNAVYGVFNATRLLTLENTQSLAVALRRDAGDVRAVWLRAKEARDRELLAAERAEERRLCSWADLPLPSLALRNLLESQSMSVDRLPYSMLGVIEPPLSTVYVRQHIRSQDKRDRQPAVSREGTPAERSPVSQAQTTLSVLEAIERHDHLLVTGEAGAGKSTMTSYLARTLSRVWLRETSAAGLPLGEPVVPLRIAARTLDVGGSWSVVLAQAVSRSLGRSLLQDPDPAIFTRRAQGARWLILVDGLDEIPDARQRREIITSIAQHARAGRDYRFVVTTRPLPDDDLSPLISADVARFAIQPFGHAELDQFARRWFGSQRLDDPEDRADRFLRETSDGRLKELVRNPLLATIAGVSAVRDPDRPLPTSRISLYERFCGYLLDDHGGRRETMAQLHRHYANDPDRLTCVLWIHKHRTAIIGALALSRTGDQTSLWSTAKEWVRRHAPHSVTEVEQWKSHLWEELLATGLLVATDGELAFLHQSFAEYLSAKSHASTLDADFAALDGWIRRGIGEAERTFALFVFGLWAARADHQAHRIVDVLLSRYDPRRTLLAGRILAEGVRVDDPAAERVVTRLDALIRNENDTDRALEAVQVLGGLFDYRWVSSRLAGLASLDSLPVRRRVEAIVALEQLAGPSAITEALNDVLPSCYGRPLRRMAPMAVRLGAPIVEQIRERVQQMVAEADADAEEWANAVEVLKKLGLQDDTERFACSVLSNPFARQDDLKKAAEALFDAKGMAALPQVIEFAQTRPAADYTGRAALADLLRREGAREASATIVEQILADDSGTSSSGIAAVTTDLHLRGSEAVPAVLRLEERWSRDGSWLASGDLLEAAAKVVPDDRIAGRARQRAVSGIPLGADLYVRAWLAVEGIAAVPEIMKVTDGGRRLIFLDRVWVAKALHDVGALPEAWELAENALRCKDRGLRTRYRDAGSLLLKVDHDRGIPALMEIVEGDANNFPLLGGLLDALQEHDSPTAERALRDLADKLTHNPYVSSVELRDALITLVRCGEKPAAVVAAQAAIHRQNLTIDDRKEIAAALASYAELELAQEVWSHLMRWQEYSLSSDVTLVDDMIAAGAADWAAQELRAQLDDPLMAARRRTRLRQMLALLTAAADVPGPAHPDDAPGR